MRAAGRVSCTRVLVGGAAAVCLPAAATAFEGPTLQATKGWRFELLVIDEGTVPAW